MNHVQRLSFIIVVLMTVNVSAQEAVTLHIIDSASGGQPPNVRVLRIDVVEGARSERLVDGTGGTRVVELDTATRFVAIEAGGFARRVLSAQQLRREGSATVALLRTRTVTGQVLDAADGTPLAGTVQVRIQQEREMTFHTERANEHGVFSVDVPLTEVEFIVWATDYSSQTFSVPPQVSSPIVVRLARAGSIEGTLRDAAGQAVVGATVSLKPSDRRNTVVPFATTDSFGGFALRSVSADVTYSIGLERSGCVRETLGTLKLSAGEERRDLALRVPSCRK